jgi:hypothetical protein
MRSHRCGVILDFPWRSAAFTELKSEVTDVDYPDRRMG